VSAPAVARAASPGPALPISEQQLGVLWRGQRFPAGALVTRAGVAVTVIFPGRPGRGPGPDFRGALIAGPSGLPLRGDVELHLRASSFRAHGHDRDAAYAGVVLHVVFEDDDGEDTALPGGGVAPVVALAPWVSRRAGELAHWLERPLLWREPCHDALARLGAERALAELDAAGDRRFEERAARFAQEIAASGLEQTLYERLLEAFGYGGNAPPMLALARLLPWAELRQRAELSPEPAVAMQALLLGSAGLLPSQRGHRGPLDDHVVALEACFAAARLPHLEPGLWKTWGVRPANAPARRIAAAAALLASVAAPSGLLGAAGAATVHEATAAFTALSARGYWLRHHDPCAGPSVLPAAYCGRSRALEILINVVLPAAAASGDLALAERARALYARLPRPAAYGATRHIEQALASEGHRIQINARRAQGLLALNKDWCTQNGCGRCPLS
jgi:hypothetical protein